MKQKTLMIFTLTIALIITFALSAGAGNFKEKHHKRGIKHDEMGFKFLKELNLSDDQKKASSEIIGNYREQVKSSLENLTRSQEVMADTIFNQSQDEQAVKQAFQDTARYREELVLIRAKIITELKTKVLTQEQLQKMEILRAEQKKKMKIRLEKKMSRIEDWLESSDL
ncbi:Uncharacterized protein dnl_53110 [Desulfonema limicola]|uniref:Periplasmic heavy metal sensor n=1 Tax=Desulfonema limicola TaxID=45656 RepID=A0A975BCT1_9BACT|nr:hypothetical protein [Desulfonema limicola]QTA82925.1 Uncharacterized protein dnl_53110 [Desulfonema limicola]